MNQDYQNLSEVLDFEPEYHQLDIGTKIDLNGKTTYHVLTNDRKVGYFIEKVYDQNQRLIRMIKRGHSSRSETDFDTKTGDVSRVFESCALPDGNTMTKEIVYNLDGKANEAVIVIDPEGKLVRLVARENIGLRTIFQGQTEYNADGNPTATVDHYLDPDNGKLMRRQQTQWRTDRQKAITEDFYFNPQGEVVRHIKTIYHPCAGPFIEETQIFDGNPRKLSRREIASFNVDGKQTSIDVTVYDGDNNVIERFSTFFDEQGQPLVRNSKGRAAF